MDKILKYFDFEYEMSQKETTAFTIVGIFLMLFIWQISCIIFEWKETVIPSPYEVFLAFGKLFEHYKFAKHLFYTLYLNFAGMFFAVIISIPLGLFLGSFPFTKALVEKQSGLFRYAPLTLMVGVFIQAFGIADAMKIAFLATGITAYLLPTVILRVQQVEKVHFQTMKTLGSNQWGIFRHVYLPSTLAKVGIDVIILMPLSWTYVIIAEMLNGGSGIGYLSYVLGRGGHADMTFAILFTIIFVGFVLDLTGKFVHRKLFPWYSE